LLLQRGRTLSSYKKEDADQDELRQTTNENRRVWPFSETCQMSNTMGDPFNSTLNMAANISECFVYQNGSTTACNEWVYDQSQYKSTLISTFDMVCDNKFVRSHTMLCHYIGILCGAFTYGMFSDTLGRRPVLTTALIGMMLPNLIRSFVSSLPLVGFLIFANGYFSMLVYQSGYVL
ncbi:hypothetical protein AM593_05864, partial [Mytilus galloprovincialis]